MTTKADKEKAKEAKAKQSANAAGAQEKMKTFFSMYEKQCQIYNTVVFIPLKRQIKQSIEECKILCRFMVDTADRTVTHFWEDEMLPDIFNEEEKPKKKRKKEILPNLVRILPLLESIKLVRYIYIQELLVWGAMIEPGEIGALAYLLHRKIYNFIKLELIDCFLDVKCLTILAPSINKCPTLRELVLDFNEFGDEGCEILCQELKKSTYLYTLSLNACCLGKESGFMLGEVIAKSNIRELSLEQNFLQNEGVIALVGEISDAIKREAAAAAAAAAAAVKFSIPEVKLLEIVPTEPVLNPDGTSPESEPVVVEKPKKKKKKPKVTKQVMLLPGPEICKLNLANNKIGRYGLWETFTPMIAMQQIKRLIISCKDLEEIDLYGSDVSDMAARLILEGLLERKANKFPQIGVRMCHLLNQDMYDNICKLAPGSKKKKKGGKKT